MTRLLSRAFRVVALAGVTLALAACSAQTPERETGSTTVPGTEVGVAQISQPMTTVGGLGVAKAVIPAPDMVTPAQQVTKGRNGERKGLIRRPSVRGNLTVK